MPFIPASQVLNKKASTFQSAAEVMLANRAQKSKDEERAKLQSEGKPVSVNGGVEPSFVGGLVRGIVKPFARGATNLIQAGQIATGHKVTEPLSGDYLGKVSSVGTNPEKTFGGNVLDALGTGAEVATTVVAPGGAKVATNVGKELVENVGEQIVKKTAEKQLSKIEKLIMPKPTVKEARLATKEGRLVKGKDPTFFRSGTEDTVLASLKTKRATKVIQEKIPGAAKMKEPELYTALESKTGEMAQSLRPEMEKVKIQPKTIEKINSDWDALKKNQIKNADATEEANVIKQQMSFEEKLKNTKSDNMNDLWESRKEYDASIPENVKKANSLSDIKLQNKKEMWLQNREVLNSAINDAELGMGKAARKPFSEMSDMYHAKENLITKAKIETAIKPSTVKKIVEHPVVKYGLGGVGVLEGVRRLYDN